MTFGQWIREQRESRRMTITECAQIATMKQQQWSRLEADEPRRKDGSPPVPTKQTMLSVARALHLPIAAVERAAGFLPADDPESDWAEVQEFYDGLPPNVQDDVKAQIEALYRKHQQQTRLRTQRVRKADEAD